MKNIFVGNLDFAVTEPSLPSVFEPYGAIKRLSLVTDRGAGLSRGFAFVEMTDISDADRAIAGLNGCTLEGRPLNVTEAKPRPQTRS
jgi:RNA recognition motif-containing protein